MSRTYIRPREIFYTPAQVTVYLNGYLLDDARTIDYRVVDNWTPLYGHNDIFLRTYAAGQTLVEGSLAINFRYHGYLKRIISALQDQQQSIAGDPSEISALRHGELPEALSDEVLQQESATVLNFLDAAAESTDPTYKVVSDFLKDRFWGDSAPIRDPNLGDLHGSNNAEAKDTKDERRAYQDYMRPSLATNNNLRMRVVHGADANIGRRAFAETIDRVQFRGKSYRANIVVPEGDEIIAEIYPFIARNVRPL